MKRKYFSTLSKRECESFIEENIDFISFNIGQEHFSGWTKLGFFNISYVSGKYRLYNPIYNKVIGRITNKDGNTIVSIHSYKGLTDIFSLLLLFAFSFAIISLVEMNYGYNIFAAIGLSALCCAFASIITYVATYLSKQGKEGEEGLLNFLETNLNLAQQV
jgi:hypothetical protein